MSLILNDISLLIPLKSIILDYLNVRTLFAVNYCLGEWNQVEMHSAHSDLNVAGEVLTRLNQQFTNHCYRLYILVPDTDLAPFDVLEHALYGKMLEHALYDEKSIFLIMHGRIGYHDTRLFTSHELVRRYVVKKAALPRDVHFRFWNNILLNCPSEKLSKLPWVLSQTILKNTYLFHE